MIEYALVDDLLQQSAGLLLSGSKIRLLHGVMGKSVNIVVP